MSSARGCALTARWDVRLAEYRKPLQLGLSIAGLGMTWLIYQVGGWGNDFYAYWRAASGDPYGVAWGFGSFHYAPATLPAFAPFTLLPWEAAYWVWTALMVGILVWLCRGWTLAWLAFPPVPAELFHGNVHLVIAAVTVLGFRYPAIWAIAVLSKFTPGVGPVWFLVRREWRPLVIAVATTGAIAAVSVAVSPDLWRQWFAHVLGWRDEVSPNQIPIPLLVRLPIALLVVVIGARRGWRWTVPIAVTIALPVVWIHALAVLVAVQALRSVEALRPVGPTPTAA